MPATVQIVRWTGSAGSPVESVITNINTRANAFDSHTTADTTNPIQIPAAGTNYSYWVSTRLSGSTTPAGVINNLRWFTSGTNPFGTGVTCSGSQTTGSTYTQATGTPGVTGNQLTQAAYANLQSQPVDVFANFTSAAPAILSGSLTNPSTGDFGAFMVYQIDVASTAVPGATPQATFSFRYDETLIAPPFIIGLGFVLHALQPYISGLLKFIGL